MLNLLFGICELVFVDDFSVTLIGNAGKKKFDLILVMREFEVLGQGDGTVIDADLILY